jgi:hypothetical protein
MFNQKKKGGGLEREKMHVFVVSATTNTLRVKQTPKNKKTKIIKVKNNYHFVLAISQFTIALFFILLSWSWNFELFNKKISNLTF